MNKHVVVIGAGAAGMEAAGRLSMAGFRVSLIEKDGKRGGHLNDWFKLFPDRKDSKEVIEYLEKISEAKNISLFTGTSVLSVKRNKRTIDISTDKGKELSADALVVATGFDLFKSSRKEEYGFGIYDNVITSSDLEKMFRKGELLTHGGKEPVSVGFVHCVGSRDEKVGNVYCSKLCCVTAVKQAIEVREHLPQSRVFCFYMDMRMGGAHYEELYREAQEKHGVNFIRGKVSEASETIDNKIVIKVEDTLAGRPLKMELDLLVLMAGMEMSEGGKNLAVASGLETGENRFFAVTDPHFGSNRSNEEGIFYAGTCTAPMNVTETIAHARSAVSDVLEYFGGKVS
jgi:heterodisulfide reductase subunit A